jgi:long-chain fatty acid transport protein
MKTYLRVTLKLLLPVIFASLPLTLLANGFLLPDQDAFATARGEAFVATADNASAIYYNPAGIAQLEGNNLRAGLYGIYLDPSYKPPGGGDTYHSSDHLAAVPQFFYAYSPKDFPLSFGLGVYSPFGLSTSWPQDTSFRTIATEASITYMRINPVVALKLAPNFSIGGGVTINYAGADLQQGLVWPTQPYDRFRFTGNGWGVGYNLGMLWKPHEKVSIGVSFRSATTIDLKGHTDAYNAVSLPSPPYPPYPPFSSFASHSTADANFSFPLNAAFGISYRPTPKWNLEFDADYTDWSSVGTLTIQQSSSLPPLMPQNVPTVLNWQPSWLYEFGVTRYFDNGWHVSAGYVYNENSVPDAHYTPMVADLDRHFFSVGTGHKGKVFDFDVAYQFSYGPDRTVTGSAPSAIGQTADGTYSSISHAVLLTVGMHF